MLGTGTSTLLSDMVRMRVMLPANLQAMKQKLGKQFASPEFRGRRYSSPLNCGRVLLREQNYNWRKVTPILATSIFG